MQLLDRLYRRVMGMVALAVIRAIDDSNQARQLGQIDYNVTGANGPMMLRDQTPVLGNFGHAFNPPAGTNVVLVHLGGARTDAVAIASCHPQLRLKGLAPGDSALYDSRGAYVWLTPQGIKVNANGLPVEVDNCTTFTVNASQAVVLNTPVLKVSGDIVDNTGSGNEATLKNLRDGYDAHTHPDPQGGNTGTTDHHV